MYCKPVVSTHSYQVICLTCYRSATFKVDGALGSIVNSDKSYRVSCSASVSSLINMPIENSNISTNQDEKKVLKHVNWAHVFEHDFKKGHVTMAFDSSEIKLRSRVR